MTSSGVRKIEDSNDKLSKVILDKEESLVDSYKIFDEATSLSSLAGGGDDSSGQGLAEGNFMSKAGDTWLGRYAHQFEIVTIANGIINVSRTSGASSPMLVVNPEGGVADFLDKLVSGVDPLLYPSILLHIVNQNITLRPKLLLTITNIVGTGATNIITVTVASTSALTTGDSVDISNTINFNIGDAVITVTDGTTFTYDLEATGSATPENSGDVDRGNFKLPDDTNFVAIPDTIVHALFNTVTQLWDFGTEIGSGGGGDVSDWSTFPAISNIDAANFALNDVSSIQISDSVGGIHSLLQGLVGIGTRLTLTAGEKLQVFDNITPILEIDSGGLDLLTHAISNITIAGFNDTGGIARGSISGDAGATAIRLATASGGKFIISDVITDIANFGDAGGSVFQLDMLDHRITNTKHISFDVAATLAFSGAIPTIGFDSATSRFIFNMPAGANLFVTNNNVIGSTQISNNSISSNIINASDVLQLGVDVTVPTVVGEFRSNGTDVTVFTGGVVKNLSDIGTGGEFFGPWTATHDASGETLDNLGILISNAANPADTGFIRMGNAETIVWESSPVGVDVTLQVNSSNNFVFSGSLTPSGTRTIGLVGDRWNSGFFDFLNVSNAALFSGDVFLGDTATDEINMAGVLNTDIIPKTTNTVDLGSLSKTFAFGFVTGGLGIVEGYATGFKPSGQTNNAIHFSVPTGAGKTESRVSFQTGASQVYATEP